MCTPGAGARARVQRVRPMRESGPMTHGSGIQPPPAPRRRKWTAGLPACATRVLVSGESIRAHYTGGVLSARTWALLRAASADIMLARGRADKIMSAGDGGLFNGRVPYRRPRGKSAGRPRRRLSRLFTGGGRVRARPKISFFRPCPAVFSPARIAPEAG